MEGLSLVWDATFSTRKLIHKCMFENALRKCPRGILVKLTLRRGESLGK